MSYFCSQLIDRSLSFPLKSYGYLYDQLVPRLIKFYPQHNPLIYNEVNPINQTGKPFITLPIIKVSSYWGYKDSLRNLAQAFNFESLKEQYSFIRRLDNKVSYLVEGLLDGEIKKGEGYNE